MAEEQSTRHAWEQWAWVWPALAYGLLGLQVIVAWDNDLLNGPLAAIVALTVVLGVWYAPLIRQPAAPGTAGVLIYLGLGWLTWAALIALHPAALMLAGVFYPVLFVWLPTRWAIAGATMLTMLLFGVSLAVFQPEAGWLATLLLLAALLLVSGVTIGLFINSLIRQSQDRQRLVEELTETRADLLRIEREAAVLAERQRLAREIHDTLAQDFTSVIMHLTAARLSSPETAQPHLQQAEETAREGLDEARRIVWAMRPEQLEHASLAESIERLAARFSVENGVRVKVAITGFPANLGSEREGALLRVAQEALHNVKKHALAHAVTITLSYMSDLVALDIVDDGRGFEMVNPQGFGLKSMRERVTELGGALTVESGRGQGTAVAASMPIMESS